MEKKVIEWCSIPPEYCDLCGTKIKDIFYDAKVSGPWGNICPSCFIQHKCRLGVGHGQRYEQQPEDHWIGEYEFWI